jgi:hypothetical protein
MLRTKRATFPAGAAVLIFLAALSAWVGFASGQAGSSAMEEAGHISVNGREVAYRIRSLPVNSFPELPAPIAAALNDRGCVIPQTYQAKRPENVIHASLERSGSSDWAVLCLAHSHVSLLVFFASASALQPAVLSRELETERLQAYGFTGDLGFDWGIDPATPEQVHDAQAGMAHRPPPPDHDCVADTVIDRKTVYHLYRNGAWAVLDLE